MEVVLDPITWADGEAYRVTVAIDPGRHDGQMVVGCTWRANGQTVWHFGHQEDFDPTEANAVKFEAADRAAVHAEMVKRFRVVALPRDRLDDSRMDEATSGMLNVIASLARVTNSEIGFMNALVSALARYAVVSLKPEADGEFISKTAEAMRDRIAEMRRFIEATEGMREKLADIISRRGEEPTKH